MPKLLSYFSAHGCPLPAARAPSTDATASDRVIRHRSGFTLIEVAIAVTILAIMAAVGAPRMHALIQHQQVDRASQVVASDIRSAFTSAARGRVPVHIAFLASSRRYTITNRVTGDTITRRDFSTGDLTVAGLTGAVTSFDVFPSGIATTTDTIVIGDPTRYYRRVSMSRIGFVRVLQ